MHGANSKGTGRMSAQKDEKEKGPEYRPMSRKTDGDLGNLP